MINHLVGHPSHLLLYDDDDGGGVYAVYDDRDADDQYQ